MKLSNSIFAFNKNNYHKHIREIRISAILGHVDPYKSQKVIDEYFLINNYSFLNTMKSIRKENINENG